MQSQSLFPNVSAPFHAPVDAQRGVSPARAKARRVTFWSGLSLLPLSAGLLAKGLGNASLRTSLLAGAATAVALGLLRSQGARWFTEEREYLLERTVGDLEIRRYPKTVCAETMVLADSFEHSLTQAFHRLADYVFGNQIAMTTPVATLRSDHPNFESVPMRSDAQFVRSGPGAFTMRFVMPQGSSMESIAKPADPRVQLREVPPHRVAVLRFSGAWTDESLDRQGQRLKDAVKHALLCVEGEPMFAAYDGPTTLPFLRRNEIGIKLAGLTM